MIQAKESPEIIQKAEEIKLRAERRAGEILIKMKDSGERESRGGDKKSKSQPTTMKLDDLKITKDQSSRWQQIASIPEVDRPEEVL